MFILRSRGFIVVVLVIAPIETVGSTRLTGLVNIHVLIPLFQRSGPRPGHLLSLLGTVAIDFVKHLEIVFQGRMFRDLGAFVVAVDGNPHIGVGLGLDIDPEWIVVVVRIIELFAVGRKVGLIGLHEFVLVLVPETVALMLEQLFRKPFQSIRLFKDTHELKVCVGFVTIEGHTPFFGFAVVIVIEARGMVVELVFSNGSVAVAGVVVLYK